MISFSCQRDKEDLETETGLRLYLNVAFKIIICITYLTHLPNLTRDNWVINKRRQIIRKNKDLLSKGKLNKSYKIYTRMKKKSCKKITENKSPYITPYINSIIQVRKKWTDVWYNIQPLRMYYYLDRISLRERIKSLDDKKMIYL